MIAPFVVVALAPGAEPDEGAPENNDKFGHAFLDRLSNTQLPFILDDSAISIDLQPKLGDVIREPYIRLPIELNYAFTRHREGEIGFIPYFANPLDDDPESSDGYLTLGLKQRLYDLVDDRLSLAVGLDARIALEEIPTDKLRESFDAYVPYVTAAYRIDDSGRWLGFTTLEYHFVGADRRETRLWMEEPPSLAVFRPGVIFHEPDSQFRYSMQLEYKTDRVDGGKDDGVKLVPGITWFPPPDTFFFRSIAGHFEFTLEFEYALSEIEEEEGGSEIGTSLNVRWRLYPKRSRPEDSVL